MTDDFEKRARDAAERYATGDHSVSFADTHDMAAFIEGSMWARAEMQAEYAETAKQQWRKLKAELERASGEIEVLKAHLDEAYEDGVLRANRISALQDEIERLNLELVALKEIYKQLNDFRCLREERYEELKLIAVSDSAKIAKLEKERDCYAEAMAVALHDGIFGNKSATKARIEQILARLDGGET